MLEWLKKFFNPKSVARSVVDSLDLAAPLIASEIDKLKEKPFNKMTSLEQAQFGIDKVQELIRARFSL